MWAVDTGYLYQLTRQSILIVVRKACNTHMNLNDFDWFLPIFKQPSFQQDSLGMREMKLSHLSVHWSFTFQASTHHGWWFAPCGNWRPLNLSLLISEACQAWMLIVSAAAHNGREPKVFLKPMLISCWDLVLKTSPSENLQQCKWLQTRALYISFSVVLYVALKQLYQVSVDYLLSTIPFGTHARLKWLVKTHDQNMEQLSYSITAITNGNGRAQFICCYMTVTIPQFFNSADDVRHHWSANATTPWFVMQCCTFCFSFFTLSCLLSNSIHDHGCFTIHSEQMFMNKSQILIKSLHFRNRCGAAIC